MENIQDNNRPFAVITGASTGIGYELAKQFVNNGFDLLIVADEERIQSVASEIQKGGTSVEPFQTDLATSEGVEALFKEIQSFRRPVDALVLNAGVAVGGQFVETDLNDDLKLLRLNIVSPVHLAKLVLKDMVSKRKGRVLITSSIASTMPGPYYATYAASKAFLQSFALAIRNELQESGVTVTALLPGPTDTEFFNRSDMNDTKVGEGKKDDPAEVAQQGFEALMAGKDQIIAGSFMNKIQAEVAKILPEKLKASIHAKQTKPKGEAA